jgi:hypothetical protein
MNFLPPIPTDIIRVTREAEASLCTSCAFIICVKCIDDETCAVGRSVEKCTSLVAKGLDLLRRSHEWGLE